MRLTFLVAGLTTGPVHAENTIRWAPSRDIGSLDPDSFGDTFTLWISRMEAP